MISRSAGKGHDSKPKICFATTNDYVLLLGGESAQTFVLFEAIESIVISEPPS